MKMRQFVIDPIIVTSDFLQKNSCQKFLQHCQNRFKALFLERKPVPFLMQQHVAVVDELLRYAWKKHILQTESLFLIAIGGYGRGELHPYSDIDLLILSKQPLNELQQNYIHQFVQFCWDIGLEIRHSVQTTQQCFELAKQDVSVFTNLLEASLLEGEEPFLNSYLQEAIANCWNNSNFYHEKMNELYQRHHKYGGNFSNLEPHIKNGPGGLRDIHTVFWLAKKILSIETIFKKDELKDLYNARDLLWQIRYALHFFAERKEDRLLFDYQKKLADFFEFHGETSNLVVEHFMKHFFVNLKPLQEVLELAFQIFHETLIKENKFIYQDDLFSISAQHVLTIYNEQLFQQSSDNLVKLFLLIAGQEKVERLSANTIRMIRENRNLSKINYQLFLQLLKQPGSVDNALIFMNRFGVLGYFIEPFQNIVGQMQYDLFHIYTVDQHSLFVVKQLCYFRELESKKNFLLCYELMTSIQKPELLFIAAIFHDIGKGQERDHSELGAEYVDIFCQNLNLDKQDIALVSWLVRNHLLMSQTAQKNDIYDPDVIERFMNQVGSVERLKYLYLLTVADICSTNPKLWNSWKDTLLQELFRATQLMFEKQNNKLFIIKQKKRQALKQLLAEFAFKDVKKVWRIFDKDYFLRETNSSIAWQIKSLVQLKDFKRLPFISIRAQIEQGAIEIFILSKYHVNLFAITTTILSNLSFNIAEANIRVTKDRLCLSSYVVLMSEKFEDLPDTNFEHLKSMLIKYYNSPENLPTYRTRRIPRELKHFLCPTEVKFSDDKKNKRTKLELVSLDRPGLLAQISQIFVKQHIQLQMAKIMTMGEKVEDVFFITDMRNAEILSLEKQTELKDKILKILKEYEQPSFF